MAERQLTLMQEPTILRWTPWDPRNGTPLRNARARFTAELELLGVSVDEIGGWDVRPVDSIGRITATGQASWLLEECLWLLRLMRRYLTRPGYIDPPVDGRLEETERRLRSGSTDLQFWEGYMEMLTLLSVVLEDEPELKAELHEWVVDPFLFQADCCGVFLSEFEGDDVLVLTSEEGYAFAVRNDLDRLFHFRGETTRGRPRFVCSDASAKRRRKLTKRKGAGQDKIQEIERLRGLAAKKNGQEERKEDGTDD